MRRLALRCQREISPQFGSAARDADDELHQHSRPVRPARLPAPPAELRQPTTSATPPRAIAPPPQQQRGGLRPHPTCPERRLCDCSGAAMKSPKELIHEFIGRRTGILNALTRECAAAPPDGSAPRPSRADAVPAASPQRRRVLPPVRPRAREPVPLRLSRRPVGRGLACRGGAARGARAHAGHQFRPGRHAGAPAARRGPSAAPLPRRCPDSGSRSNGLPRRGGTGSR
jgi:hypothetical protein